MMNKNLLRIDDLHVSFFTDYGEVKAVRGISIDINPKEVVGLVGESGCGKSITSFSILNLIPRPGKITKGNIFFKEDNIAEFKQEDMIKLRGKNISMIFQEPMTSLNPVFRIGDQIGEIYKYHTDISKSDIKLKVIRLLDKVQIPNAENVYNYYPHQLSGGMRQRVMIAMAITLKPDLLIADEPTTALDVTVQAQILKLLFDLQKESDMAILFITHDLAVISEIADRIYVMYSGQVMESGTRDDVFNKPSHPYTKALFSAIPGYKGNYKELNAIPGTLPDNINLISGCSFHPRCEYAKDICRNQDIKIKTISKNHINRCVL